MKRALAALLLVGCVAAPRHERSTAVIRQVPTGKAPAVVDTRPRWEGGDGVVLAGPLSFAPSSDGKARTAAVISKATGENVAVQLAVAGGGRVELAAAKPGLELDARLAAFALDGGVNALRVDLSSGRQVDERGPFAVKTSLVVVDGDGKPRVVFDRVVERAEGARDLRATMAVRGAELVVEERATGAKGETRRLVYRRDHDGVYRTNDPSLFVP